MEAVHNSSSLVGEADLINEQEVRYTGDGSVDAKGHPAEKQSTGCWRACAFILGTECCEQLAFFGIQYNLVTFLTTQLHQSNVAAARSYTIWQGTCYITPLAGAMLADSYLGRYWTTVAFFSIYLIGMGTMTLSAAPHVATNPSIQPVVFSLGLYMMAVGSGCIKSCVGPFGADQFDGSDPAEALKKSSFFNWFYFASYVGGIVSGTALVWVQDNYGWVIGFGIPALCTVLAMASFLVGSRTYRYQKPRGSPVVRACQVIVAALRKRNVILPHDDLILYEESPKAQKLDHTTQYRFLDKAAIASSVDEAAQPWRLCTVTQVEELKAILRMLPIWATGIVYCMVLVQQSLFLEQGRAMRQHLGAFSIPPASLNSIYAVTVLALVPLYDRAIVPVARRLTGNERGFTELQRIGLGLALSVVAMAAAASVEARRLATMANGRMMSIGWQVPQYLLLGTSAVFCTITVTVVSVLTARGGSPGWIADDLNDGHLDRFFWLVAGLSLLNLMVFVCCANKYNGRN